MRNGIFITGTDTNVGKTWVGQQLIAALLAQNVDVVPRKPVESGWMEDVRKTDAWKLANAAKKTKQLEQICPYRFRHPVSPVRAAQLEGQLITLNDLQKICLSHIQDKQFLHVEGAGGFYSPLVSNALNADLAQALKLPILIVAEDRLGCINQILLTLEAARARGLDIIAIFLNEINSKEVVVMNNQEDLKVHTDVPVLKNIDELLSLINKKLRL